MCVGWVPSIDLLYTSRKSVTSSRMRITHAFATLLLFKWRNKQPNLIRLNNNIIKTIAFKTFINKYTEVQGVK